MDADGCINDFIEKPKTHAERAPYVNREDPSAPYIGSMGIYLFKLEVLSELLLSSSHDDFGRDVLPAAIESLAVFGYLFEGYWEDIGTMRADFYEDQAHPQMLGASPLGIGRGSRIQGAIIDKNARMDRGAGRDQRLFSRCRGAGRELGSA